jgi:hypothetical protein
VQQGVSRCQQKSTYSGRPLEAALVDDGPDQLQVPDLKAQSADLSCELRPDHFASKGWLAGFRSFGLAAPSSILQCE